MESDLRAIIGKYGVRAVHEGLLREMQQTFAYLKTIFEPKKNEVLVPVVSATIPEPVTSPHLAPQAESLDIATLDELCLPDAVVGNSTGSTPSCVPTPPASPQLDSSVKAVSFVPKIKADKMQVEANTELKPKITKDDHKALVQKKKLELETKGILPRSLMTKESLEKWINEGKSYMWIARETGVNDSEVSDYAKTHGLQSKMQRYMIMKKNQKK